MRLTSLRPVIAATALLLGLAACAEADQPTGETGGTAAGAGFPVTIEHRYGTTTIESQPQRVVTVGLMEQDALLALGVVPVATTAWFGEYPGAIWPWAQDELGDASPPEVLTDTDGIQFERIAALQPDLIVGLYSGLTEEDYRTLSELAPTVAQPKDAIDFGVSWQQVTETIGAAVGRQAEAQELIAGIEQRFADVRAANPAFEDATAMAVTTWEGYFVYGPEDPRGLLLQDLGFRLPEGLDQVTGTEFGANLSRERTDLLDTDVVVWLVDEYATDKARVHADPLYAQLDAKLEGRDIFLESLEPLGAATSFITVLSLPFLLDGLVPMITAAVDGDPATEVPQPPATSSRPG